jgi:hypothetical protein
MHPASAPLCTIRNRRSDTLVLVYSRPEGVTEMFATSFRVFFLAMAIFAILAVAFLLATA